ncbi:cytochrome b [Agrobacterium cavarae]|uniref:cytochrome b n=1 Tax=Agrobacterium cavarae TaxID=2528239 RepID=UPI003EE5EEF5
MDPRIGRKCETNYRYQPIQRFLHWTMAAMIITALGLGLYCSYLPHGSDQREFLLEIHKSLGMTALCLIVLRIPIRASSGEPAWRVPPSPLVRIASKAGHGLLYVLMLIMPVTGYMTSGSEGRSIPWFGLFSWPNFMTYSQSFGQTLSTVHDFGGYAFFAVLGLHLVAVAWHRLVKKDEVLSRMV